MRISKAQLGRHPWHRLGTYPEASDHRSNEDLEMLQTKGLHGLLGRFLGRSQLVYTLALELRSFWCRMKFARKRRYDLYGVSFDSLPETMEIGPEGLPLEYSYACLQEGHRKFG